MKKTISIYIILVALILHSSCSSFAGHKPELQDVIKYAEDHQDELISSAVFLLDEIAEESSTIKLSIIEDEVFRKYSYHDETEEEVFLPILSPLFDCDMIEIITVRDNAVEYLVGGTGGGSNMTYYLLDYIPSGKIEDLFGYSEAIQMHYDAKTGGFYGEEQGSDNTLYYYMINKNLYYLIAHY